MKKVVVVGGGAAGLSAAYTLKKHGIEPILLETNPRAGGRLGGDRAEGFHIDEGADFICSTYDTTFKLCKELGLQVNNSNVRLTLYSEGEWISPFPVRSPLDAIRDLPAFWKLGLLQWNSLKLIKHIKDNVDCYSFGSKSRVAEMDHDETYIEFLNRYNLPKRVVDLLRGYCELAVMGNVEEASPAHVLCYVADTLLNSGKLYVPEGGMGSIGHALADQLGDAVRLSTTVRNIDIQDGKVVSVTTDDGQIDDMDAVICTVPAGKVSGLIPKLPDEIRSALDMVTYSVGTRVVMGLDKPPLPPGIWGALYNTKSETLLLLDRSINLPKCVPPGKHTLDIISGRNRGVELNHLSDDEIKHRMLGDARRNAPPGSNIPADDEGIFTNIYRWDPAICVAKPGMFKAMLRMREELPKRIDNLFLAGDYTRVPVVNGALTSGVEAGDDVARMLAA